MIGHLCRVIIVLPHKVELMYFETHDQEYEIHWLPYTINKRFCSPNREFGDFEVFNINESYFLGKRQSTLVT